MAKFMSQVPNRVDVMEKDSPAIGRRKVLSATAAGLGALMASGAAAGKPGRGRGRGRGPPEHAQAPLELEDGRVHPTSQKGNARAAVRAAQAAAPGPSDGPAIQVSAEERAQMLNEAAEDGVIDLDEQNGEIVVQFTSEEGA